MTALFARMRCIFRGMHSPVRQPVGGFRCVDCGEAGSDLGQMGYRDVAYVRPDRYSAGRDRGGAIRSV